MKSMIGDRYDSDDEVQRRQSSTTARRPRGAALFLQLLLTLGAAGCQQGVAGSLDVVPAWTAATQGAKLTPISDGDKVDLVQPIQGGHVLFIGALVRNASGDKGTIRAELRRGEADGGQPLSAPGAIIVFEERSTQLEPLPAGLPAPSASPGWQQLRDDINDLANIAACPNTLPVEIPDHTLYVQVTYTDSHGNTGFATRKVIPRCNQTDTSQRNSCLCQCRANYTIERCLVYGDGGVPD